MPGDGVWAVSGEDVVDNKRGSKELNGVEYLLQKEGSCCALFSLCNALRYFGRSSPEPGTDKWEELERMAKCEFGSAISIKKAAKYLGIQMISIRVEEAIYKLPAMLDVLNPRLGHALHSVLIVGGDINFVELVNYRTKVGPVVEKLFWQEVSLPLPGNINRRCWQLKLVEG